MNVNEVSLRDLLYYQNEEMAEKMVVMVHSVRDVSDPYNGFGMSCILLKDNNLHEAYLSPIAAEGIPISPELLLLNGFTFSDINSVGWKGLEHYDKMLENGFITCWETFEKGLWHIKVSSTNNNLNVEVRSIHELQHALRVAHLSELADNFKIKK